MEEDRAAAALEVMSRFALDPRWLLHLPPTMSPSETTIQPGYLERPAEAFAYYHAQGISRAVLVLCRDEAAAARRFGLPAETLPGACYTRTGRQFFEDEALNDQLITRLTDALTATGSGSASRRIGPAWTPRSCPGTPRRGAC